MRNAILVTMQPLSMQKFVLMEETIGMEMGLIALYRKVIIRCVKKWPKCWPLYPQF